MPVYPRSRKAASRSTMCNRTVSSGEGFASHSKMVHAAKSLSSDFAFWLDTADCITSMAKCLCVLALDARKKGTPYVPKSEAFKSLSTTYAKADGINCLPCPLTTMACLQETLGDLIKNGFCVNIRVNGRDTYKIHDDFEIIIMKWLCRCSTKGHVYAKEFAKGVEERDNAIADLLQYTSDAKLVDHIDDVLTEIAAANAMPDAKLNKVMLQCVKEVFNDL